MLQKNGIYYVFFSLQERYAPFATWFVVNRNVNTANLVGKYGEFGRQIRRVCFTAGIKVQTGLQSISMPAATTVVLLIYDRSGFKKAKTAEFFMEYPTVFIFTDVQNQYFRFPTSTCTGKDPKPPQGSPGQEPLRSWPPLPEPLLQGFPQQVLPLPLPQPQPRLSRQPLRPSSLPPSLPWPH